MRISKAAMLSSQHLELQLFYSLVSEGHNQLESKKKEEIVFLREEASHCRKIWGLFLGSKGEEEASPFVINHRATICSIYFLNGLQNLFGCSGHIVSPFFFHERH